MTHQGRDGSHRRSGLRFRGAGFALAIAGLLTLAACSAPAPFQDLPTAELPESVVSSLGTPVASSVHEVGTDSNGNTYYTARWDEKQDGEVCLVVDTSADFFTACSADFPVSLGFMSFRAELHDQAVDASDGREVIGTFVTVESM